MQRAVTLATSLAVSLQPPLHSKPVTSIPINGSKLKVASQVEGTMSAKKRKMENGKNASASAIFAHCHGHRTCRGPCRAAAYAHRLFLALIYLPAKPPFVINLSLLSCMRFPCTDYLPWWVKTNRHSFSFSFWGVCVRISFAPEAPDVCSCALENSPRRQKIRAVR